jgi:hypothetical protein
MQRLLGKLPHVPGAISWNYGDIFNRKKLTHYSKVFGHIWNNTKIDILGNDKAGCCVWCTQANVLNTMQRAWSDEGVSRFSAASVLGDYSADTGYDPAKPETDVGTNMADAAKYWRNVGIADATGKRHRIDAYVQLRIKNMDELLQATFDFDAVALGVQLPQSAKDQFGREPWTVVKGSPILGGHAVTLAGLNSQGHAIIATWDGITAATPEWVAHYADEAVAFVSLEALDKKGLNSRGYDRTELLKRIAGLGSVG